jgi:hypothetical protein
MTKKRRGIAGTLLGLWWVSWFGIIGGFLLVGIQEYRRELSQGGVAAFFSLALLISIVLCWVAFYVATFKFGEQWPAVWRVFTIMGTILAALTIVSIYFFVSIAPRVR